MRRLSDTLFLTWLSVLFMLSAFPAQALTCKTTSSTISEVVNIESIIKVSSSVARRFLLHQKAFNFA